MSAVAVAGVAASEVGSDELDVAAAMARHALGCDCTIVTWHRRGQEPIVGANGIDAEKLGSIWMALQAFEMALTSGTARRLESSGEDGAGGAIEDELGYRLHMAAPLIVNGRRAGALHVLHGDSSKPIDSASLEALAAHCAVALGHGRPRSVALIERVERGESFDQLVLASETLAELAPRIEEAMGRVFGGVRTGIMVWDDERSVLQMVPGSFGAPESVTASYQIDPRDLHSNAALVFGLQRAYLSNQAVGDPGILQDFVEAFAIERLISLPLIVADRPTGVLHVAKSGEDFTAADLQRCEELMPRVAIAVESTRMLMRLSMQRELESVLSKQAVAIASGTGSDACMRESLEELRRLLRAGIVALVPTGSDPSVAKEASMSLTVEKGLLDEARGVRGERAKVVRPQGAGDPGCATLYVPVRLGTRRVGTLAAFRDRSESFTLDERRGMSRMANLIALSWASERYQQQRAALARLEERQRIADDLHDDVAQILFAAQMQLDSLLELEQADPDVRALATHARGLLIRGDSSIRNVIAQLSRPVPTSLADRLAEIVDGVEEEFMIPIHLEISSDAADAGLQVRRAIADTIVKVAREALVNAAKHAGPCRVSVMLDCPSAERLRLRVSDDGVKAYARVEERSHGLASLRRGVRRHSGSLRLLRGAAGGTTVAVTLPV